MGEYAKLRGEQVKIGTCEDMYYLRFDQRRDVEPEGGSVDPVRDAAKVRFRFPWPDEDQEEPGSGKFHDNGYHRSVHVPGIMPPEGVDHHSVQFTARGYLTSLPCPESEAFEDIQGGRELVGANAGGLHVSRNGFGGSVHLVSQKLVPGVGLVPIMRCGGCGSMWREEDHARVEAIAVALRAEGDRQDHWERISRESHDRQSADPIKWAPMPSAFLHTIADRVLAGLLVTA